MLARAPSNMARVLRASTSSTVRPSLRAPPRQPRRRCRAVQGEALRPRLALAAQFPESQARRRRKRASSAPGWPAWSNHGSNWLCACVSLRRSRNIKSSARRASRVSSALNQRNGEYAGTISFQLPLLIARRSAIYRCVVAMVLDSNRTAKDLCGYCNLG